MPWIETNSSGHLRLCDRVKVDGKLKQFKVPLEKDTPQARRIAMERLQEKISQNSTPMAEKPMNEAVEMYLARDIRESTRMLQGSVLHRMVQTLGNVPLHKLTAPLIKRMLLETGKPPKTLNNYLQHIKSFLNWCFEFGYIQDDVARRLRKFPDKTKPKNPEDLYMEPDELKNVLDQLSGMMYYCVKFLALTGLRVGEMSALTVSDISDNYISITKSYNYRSRMLTEPKNQSSIREVYIQPELRDLLDEYMKWRLLYMMSQGVRTDLLFFTRDGDRMKCGNLDGRLKCIGKKYHVHLLRHTHTALLAEQGISLDAIARRLGHVSDRTTRDVYFHVTKKQRQKDEMAISKVHIL